MGAQHYVKRYTFIFSSKYTQQQGVVMQSVHLYIKSTHLIPHDKQERVVYMCVYAVVYLVRA